MQINRYLIASGLIATVWMFPAHLFAQTTAPSFDCSQATTSAEELICADAELAALDRQLNDRFTAALSAATQMGASTQNAVDTLRAMQRGWIKGRDDCWKADDLRGCVQAAYLIREGELVAKWMLQDPLSVASYTCEGNPANTVTAYFFDTSLPSIRLEYGDSIRTGSLVRAASGSKYTIELGGIFWTEADTAQFAWNEGQEMSCVRSD